MYRHIPEASQQVKDNVTTAIKSGSQFLARNIPDE